MSPRPERQRPGPQSQLVRRPEPITTSAAAVPADPATPPPAAPAGKDETPRSTPRRAAQPRRPAARDLVAPPRPSVAREALKADVPAELDLVHRLRRYRLDKGVDIRDQVALAVDGWLTSQGY